MMAAPVYTSLFTITCLYLFTLTYPYFSSLYSTLYYFDKIDNDGKYRNCSEIL